MYDDQPLSTETAFQISFEICPKSISNHPERLLVSPDDLREASKTIIYLFPLLVIMNIENGDKFFRGDIYILGGGGAVITPQ